MKKAIVLLSGGLDSATTLYIALKNGFDSRCLIFDYGQRHKKEIFHAQRIAEKARCDYRIVKLALPWHGSSLINKDMTLPLDRDIEEIAREIPSTYVPSRNTIFISIAAAWAEVVGAEAIFIGANAVDFSGYPDCRPEYYEDFNRLLKKGTKAGREGKPIKIEAPLIDKKKGEIIKIGTEMAVPYELTWSCYEGARRPCQRCDACLLRKKGFDEAGLKDPLVEISYAGI